MKAFLNKILLATLTVICTAACVHEYPENGGVDPTRIETTIRLTTRPEFTHSAFLASRNEAEYMFFVVEIYKDNYNSTPVVRKEIGADRNFDASATVEFTECLNAGNYKVVAWAVCADEADGSGKVFSMDDLANVGYLYQYRGSDDRKECYEVRFDMAVSSDEWNARQTYSREMLCPMGSVEVISTDVREFFSRMAALRSDPTWDDYIIKWVYGMYFPVGYNVYTGRPNKAETQVSFISEIVQQSETEASLGFDYVFVNGEESQVTLTLLLYDRRTGKLLNIYSDIQVPLTRGKTTVIRGQYLTDRKDSGAVIDPGFEGDINISLPD